jgi:hypothetical protein
MIMTWGAIRIFGDSLDNSVVNKRKCALGATVEEQMEEFHYTPVNGHAVARIHGRQFLLAPGLPFSIANRPLLLEGQKIEVEAKVLGLTLEDLIPRVGVELDGVLGANVSDRFVVNIDPRDYRLEFDQYQKYFPISVPVDNLGGAANWHVSIGGRRARALLDLGSKLSLIHPDLVEGLEPDGRETEVLGFIGPCEMDVYSLPVLVDREAVHLRFAAVPPEIALRMELANVQAIIGYELLEHYALSLAMSEGELSLDPLH